MISTRDAEQTARERQRERLHFRTVRNAETTYARQLRAIARHVGMVIRSFPIGDPQAAQEVTEYLRRYSYILRPWAQATATRMLAEVSRRDQTAWMRASKQIGMALRQEIEETPIGDEMWGLLNDQIDLITSIPLDAAEEVQDLTMQYVAGGRRYADLVPQIMQMGAKTENRATLIARTETAKAASALTQARAQYIGSTHYIWQTAMDADVRKAHKKLQGSVQAWNEPPLAEENGERHHPGNFPNCFTGETLVRPVNATTIFRAIYSGPLVLIDTGKAFFRVTPNHPILTPKGWIAAGKLKHSDKLVTVPSQGTNVIKDNVDKRLFTFEQIFEAFTPDGGRCQSLFIDNFYGDIVEHQVEIVRPKQYLSFSDETEAFGKFSDEVIASADSGICRASVKRVAPQIGQTGLAGFCDPLFSFSNARVGRADRVSFTDVAFRHTRFAQNIAYRPATTGEALRQSQHTFAGVVLFDYLTVRDIWSDVHHGYVYTMETEDGYYGVTPAGIIAKNCRCWAEPILPETIE